MPPIRRLLQAASRWLLLGGVALGALAGILLTALMTRQYASTARLEITRDTARVVDIDSVWCRQPKRFAAALNRASRSRPLPSDIQIEDAALMLVAHSFFPQRDIKQRAPRRDTDDLAVLFNGGFRHRLLSCGARLAPCRRGTAAKRPVGRAELSARAPQHRLAPATVRISA